jgi:integrase
MAAAKLTDTQVSRSRGKDKPYKLTDGHGLFLYITPTGGKFWRWQYRFHGKPQLLSLGEYPLTSLKEARTEQQRWQGVLRGGLNPADEKKKEKKAEASAAKLNQERSALAKLSRERLLTKLDQERSVAESIEKVVWPVGSFGAVQTEWFEQWSDKKAPRYRDQMESRITADILPKLGHRHITDIEAPDIADMATEIESRGAEELARKALRTTGQIFRFAIARGYARRNPAADFRPGDVLKEQAVTNHPRVDSRDLPKLLLDMDEYTGTEIARYAMWIMARTFLRTSELAQAPWTEIDLEQGWWEIPKERMKMPSPHIVPLSRQVIRELQELKGRTGGSDYVFPGAWDREEKSMSSGAISGALKRMGYRGIMTGHGYRGIASTILHEGARASPVLMKDGYPESWI